MVESQRRPLVLVHLLLALLVMVLTSFLPSATPTATHNLHSSRHDDQQKKKKKRPPAHEPPPSKSTAAASSSSSSWHQLKSLLSCRSATAAAVAPQIHDPPVNKLGRTAAACGASICAIRDVVHGNTRVVHRSDTDLSSVSDAGSMSQRETAPLARSVNGRSARHAQPVFLSGCGGAYTRGAALPLRRLSGCAECHAVSVEPSSRRYPRPRELCACQQCGEVFTKSESLELHQAIRHAVSELGPEDSGRNIVEIIFKSSWQKKDRPIVQIERILKVHNAPRTVARFEDYRSSIKSHALLLHHLAAGGGAAAALRHHHQPILPSPPPPQQQQKKNPRCAADGNELLRFHCTALSCPLGARGSTSLCANSSSSSAAPCAVCTVIRHGFAKAGGHLQHHPLGVRTTASSGRAHDHGPPAAGPGELRAMLVCRVIAGRIRRPGDESPPPSSSAAAGGAEDGGYDSVAGEVEGEAYGNLEELFVANPRAILPCFVVIYRVLD